MNRYVKSTSGNENMLEEEPFDTLRTAGSMAGLTARDADEAVSPLSNPDSATGTAVLERPQTEEKLKGTDDGDADRFAHYVSKRRMEQSRLTGRPVVALCGKIWVPKHDPSQYPVCPECKRIYEQMMGGAGNGEE